MSLSCIVQTLWDLCECDVIIEATVSFFYIKLGFSLNYVK